MSKKLQYFPELFFIFIIVFFIPRASQVLGDESEVISRASQADDSLEAAYLSMLEAERAGGDISELVPVFNIALEYYSEAERAVETGEYEAAIFLAGKVVEVSNVVLNADISLIVVTEHVVEAAFRNQLFLPFGVIIFFILFSFLGWGRFKGYYIRRLMGLRPEVVLDES